MRSNSTKPSSIGNLTAESSYFYSFASKPEKGNAGGKKKLKPQLC